MSLWAERGRTALYGLPARLPQENQNNYSSCRYRNRQQSYSQISIHPSLSLTVTCQATTNRLAFRNRPPWIAEKWIPAWDIYPYFASKDHTRRGGQGPDPRGGCNSTLSMARVHCSILASWREEQSSAAGSQRTGRCWNTSVWQDRQFVAWLFTRAGCADAWPTAAVAIQTTTN